MLARGAYRELTTRRDSYVQDRAMRSASGGMRALMVHRRRYPPPSTVFAISNHRAHSGLLADTGALLCAHAR